MSRNWRLAMRVAHVTSGLMAFLWGWSSQTAACAELSFTSVGDSTIYAPNSESNSNGGGSTMGAGTNGLFEARRGLVRFDLSAIPTGAVIVSASLQLTLARAGATDSPRLVSLHRALASWGENPASDAGSGSGSGFGVPAMPGDATWLARFFGFDQPWAVPGGDFLTPPSASSSITSVLETPFLWSGPGVLADVRVWQASPGLNFGWFVIGDETTDRTNRQFHTRESTTGVPPTLRVAFFEEKTLGIEHEPGGAYRIEFSGVPGEQYIVQFSPSLVQPGWQPLGTATADPQGRFHVVDIPVGIANRFYRAARP